MNMYNRRSRKGPAIAAVLGATALLGGAILAWGYAPEVDADTDLNLTPTAARTASVQMSAEDLAISDSLSIDLTRDELMEVKILSTSKATAADEDEAETTENEAEITDTEQETSEDAEIDYTEDSEESEYAEEDSSSEESYDTEEDDNSGTIGEFSYSDVFTCTAYAYVAGGYGASGNPAVVGTVAVDPSIIPLGTRLYVEGYGYAIANDTGGNIIGYTLDLVMDTEYECYQWGVRTVNVYILD